MIHILGEKPVFPPLEEAEPDGLLAAGGDLSTERLLEAYRRGIFPWYEEGGPILWWSPDPRLVLYPEDLRVNRTLRQTIRKGLFSVRADTAFPEVMKLCKKVHERTKGDTWITSEMLEAYTRLHTMGHAHSVESYTADGELAGGLYGVSAGKVFFGESMVALRPEASKVALAALATQLARWGFELIDCQMTTSHLLRFGAREIPRKEFARILTKATSETSPVTGTWELDRDILESCSGYS